MRLYRARAYDGCRQRHPRRSVIAILSVLDQVGLCQALTRSSLSLMGLLRLAAHAHHGLPPPLGSHSRASRRLPATWADSLGPSMLSARTHWASPSAGRSRYCGSPMPARCSMTTSSVRRNPLGKRFSRYVTHSPIAKRWSAIGLLSKWERRVTLYLVTAQNRSEVRI